MHDGLACSKVKKIQRIFSRKLSNVFFFNNFQRPPEGPDGAKN